MSQINRVPWGLQSLLGTKNFGKNPSDLAQSVLPTVDLGPHLRYETMRTERNTGVIAAVGDTVEIEVPVNEAWQPITFGGNVQLAGTTEFFFVEGQIADISGVAESAACWSVTRDTTPTAAIGRGAQMAFSIPFLMGPGSVFRAVLLEDTGFSGSASISVLYARFEV